MHSNFKNKLIRWGTIAALICCTISVGYVMFEFGVASFTQRKAHSRPQEFSGNWSVVGNQGDSRGILTFFPNGEINSHDDYLGMWWLESGTMHVQFWKAAPPTILEYLLPKRDEFLFSITRNEKGEPSVMHGMNVVLTAAGRASEQHASANNAVNSTGGSGGF